MKAKSKVKEKQVCSICGTDKLHITLANGEQLPHFRISIATWSVVCMNCSEKK